MTDRDHELFIEKSSQRTKPTEKKKERRTEGQKQAKPARKGNRGGMERAEELKCDHE